MTLVHELLTLPNQVLKGDFVHSLGHGVQAPEETVRTYAITPSLRLTFEHALSLLNGALESKRSRAARLVGSFGSGKSHFMAMLDLLLAGNRIAWERPELHPLKAKFPWAGEARLLRLPLHMIGAESSEQKIFEAYVSYVAKHHPEAPIPGLYQDHELFQNAAALRKTMGDGPFFTALNGEGPKANWGKLAHRAAWDAARFEAVIQSDSDKERSALFSALVKTLLPAFASQSRRFVELDRGLSILACHAATLGYRAVVLYLDELVLWLAGHYSSLDFIRKEMEKLAKLVEAEHEQRDVPVVSFIAQQRDVIELVGERAVGAEQVTLRDANLFTIGRFEPIKLEDSNLAAIVEHRVVQPRDEAARGALKDGFARMRRMVAGAWATLLAGEREESAFEKVYPFSPAVVDTLVALSSCLQRERTAIRILMELLVYHHRDLETGDLVRVGDVFDAVAGGEEAFDTVIRERFERARHHYETQLLPLIRSQNATTSAEKCQRLREDHSARLGCSGCKQAGCRQENRLAKTLLTAALVPHQPLFKELTVSRIVHLNVREADPHLPFPEAQLAAGRLRSWSTQIGQLAVGEGGDPQVVLHLEGVDLAPILGGASDADTPGARKRLLKEILFQALGLDEDAPKLSVVTVPFTWEGTRRSGQLRFGNVREMDDHDLLCPSEADYYVVVDYPFDEPGRTPEDDLQRLERFRDGQAGAANPAMVWLPTFFSGRIERELGDIAKIGHVLQGDGPRKYLGHLRSEDQARAKLDLENLKNQKKALIRRAIEQAYGIASSTDEGLLDPSREVVEHVVPLQPGVRAFRLMASGFRHALEQIAARILDVRYPNHPHFGAQVTPAKLKAALELLQQMVESPQRRLVELPAAQRKLLIDYAAPLQLVTPSESSLVLGEERLRAIDQQRERAGRAEPTVSEVRRYIDPEGLMGLPDEASDLCVLAYAIWAGRTTGSGGLPALGKLADDLELAKPELPTEVEWQAAIERAQGLLGTTWAGRHLSVGNLTGFAERLEENLGPKREAAVSLEGELRVRLERWGTVSPAPPRLATARSGGELVAQLARGRQPVELVRTLAAFEPRTSVTALARSLRSAGSVLAVLRQKALWVSFESAAARGGERAQQILERLAEALASDELTLELGRTLEELTTRIGELLATPAAASPGGWTSVLGVEREAAGIAGVVRAARELAEALPRSLPKEDAPGEYRIELNVFRRGGGRS